MDLELKEGILSRLIEGDLRIYFFAGIAFVVLILIAILVVVLKKRKSGRSVIVNTPGSIQMTLTVHSGKVFAQGTTLYLSDYISMGSQKSSDLRMEGVGVEPVHARIVRQDDKVFVEDMKSATGVAVGGMRIQERNLLRSGDVISIGDIDISFQF